MEKQLTGRGGAGRGQGRKPKAIEDDLIAMMDVLVSPHEFWQHVSAKLDSDPQAQKLWASYRFGLPKQKMELTGEGGGPLNFAIMNINPLKLNDTTDDIAP